MRFVWLACLLLPSAGLASAAPFRIDDQAVIDVPKGFSASATKSEVIVTFDAAKQFSFSIALPAEKRDATVKDAEAAADASKDVKIWRSWKDTNVMGLHFKKLAGGGDWVFFPASRDGKADTLWAGQILVGGSLYSATGRSPSFQALDVWKTVIERIRLSPAGAAEASAPRSEPDEPKGVPLLR